MSCGIDIEALPKLPLGPGWVLKYEADSLGKSWFFAQVAERTPQKLVLNWQMSRSEGMQGTVAMDQQALGHATKLHNYFSEGENLQLSDTTCVWVSREVHKALRGGQPITIDMGRGKWAFQLRGKEAYRFTANEVALEMQVLHAESVQPEGSAPDETSTRALWILDDPDNPLIVQLDLGWTVTLKDVKAKAQGTDMSEVITDALDELSAEVDDE